MRYLFAFVVLTLFLAALRAIANAVFAAEGLAVGMIFCAGGIVFFIALASWLDRQRAAQADRARRDSHGWSQTAQPLVERSASPEDR